MDTYWSLKHTVNHRQGWIIFPFLSALFTWMFWCYDPTMHTSFRNSVFASKGYNSLPKKNRPKTNKTTNLGFSSIITILTYKIVNPNCQKFCSTWLRSVSRANKYKQRPLSKAEWSVPPFERTGSSFEARLEKCHFTPLTARLDKGPYRVNGPSWSPCCGGWEKAKTMLRDSTTRPCGGGDARI